MASVLSVTQSQNTRILQLLLQGPTSTQDVRQALVYASTHGLAECAQCILASGVSPDIEDPSNCTPLHAAVSEGHAEVAAVLCQAGADVNAKNSSGNSPVHIASKMDRGECLQVLLQYKCHVNSTDSSGNTPLILAVTNKSYAAVKLLLEAGCKVNASGRHGRTALHVGSLSGTAVDQLLHAGADVNICDEDGCSPLLYAATEGLERVIASLCKAPHCNPNLANSGAGKTPLHILAYKGHHDSVKALMEAGAHAHLQDGEGKTAMWYAVANAHVRVVQMLLIHSFDSQSFKCSALAPATTCPAQLAVDKGLSQILALFVLSRFDDHHLTQCMQQPQSQALFLKTSAWGGMAQQVASLQQICRKLIRHFLGRNVSPNLSQLPVPNKFINYILMTELEECILVVK